MLLLAISGSYSQKSLTINEIQRDSIYSKIIRGNKALEQNKVLHLQLVERDSVIALHVQKSEASTLENKLLKEQIANLNQIILNKNSIISNERKKAKRKGFLNFLKGAAVGGGIVLILTL